ncbi:hypothetical protein LUZ63_007679 [Rhynchospora breviuscula]|uniref:AB hydrolase-1 domain-containing protein n=1 Tax=Rhynchospora breviuscula TaxID=2022672 RepID=A0A9Q0CS56_9POAL|nr:hypothetical protein LUZ63_007679 [Rhynchospora breviuscula]
MSTPLSIPQRALSTLISALGLVVFTFLDLLDFLLCYVYRFLDELFEKSSSRCYCGDSNGEERSLDEEISKTLHERENIFRTKFSLDLRRDDRKVKGGNGFKHGRWSDCCCESCISWQEKGEGKLHVVTNVPNQGTKGYENETSENVIFIHGFLSSSSFWAQTVFPQTTQPNFKLFAMDLLGFGRSPKPADCLYKLEDHTGMIVKSVIESYQLESFHLVAHSMGCIIALNLAAKYPDRVKSVTLLAPPYYPSNGENASHDALNKLAKKKIWPPLAFGSAIMSWYEHVGRTVCLAFCRNHLIWERIVKLLTGKRELHFFVTDMTKHTHHSAWHTMHNVICGGAKTQDKNLEIIKKAGISVKIIHGDKDQMVPTECSYNMKSSVPHAELQIMNGHDHNSMIVGREKELTRELEEYWLSASMSYVTREQ